MAATEGAPGQQTTGGASARARRVLVIEDETNIAEAIRFILGRDGWEVSVHGRGDDALAAVGATAPDLLVLDVMLPGCSGLDVLAALRADPDLAGLPVLVLTARGRGIDRAVAMAAGADAFLAKPFVNADFLSAVRTLAAPGAAARAAE
ncbi:MAG TPA: response regulator [Paracoccaceae bacterium]|nr:response regulator [Paracoccaceae bacterium]